ncbi:VirK/YbjX family protein [Pelosinus propionicus]|uniref:DUF535 domain-containing protein n=1 Tax=Pelosinus propionicus DSM 13327 TaxID=1123291 RepID=A0A1I4LQM0_9FIRM|nr:DUF535 family protein [Pelosinus propionicus]SFL93103.1 hypothetical protein SAMN04490355_102628 [Pelosinus propionicus DSM 13327]
MKQLINLSAKIYSDGERHASWRKFVFLIRTVTHYKQMMKLIEFFEKNHLRRDISIAQPCIFEQATRQWFYHQSSFSERTEIIKKHYLFVNDCLKEDALRKIYLGDGIPLWSQKYQNEMLSLTLHFSRGSHDKEGLLAILLKLGDKRIYQIIFWLAPNQENEMALWIGALQGSPNGLQISRGLTKFFYGYRTKNFIFHALCTVACELGLKKIYAVSNYGFYANNHIRLDRKLKTSLDDFWQEIGGKVCKDARFFELPTAEIRKNLNEVDSHKRNLYRKRFLMLDETDSIIIQSFDQYLKKNIRLQVIV